MKFLIAIGGVVAVVVIGFGAYFLFFSGKPSPSVGGAKITNLAEVTCDGFTIRLKQRVVHSITGTHTERYFWYHTGDRFSEEGKEIHDSGSGFPTANAPEHFQWFEITTETKKKDPPYRALNLVLSGWSPDIPKDMQPSSRENSSNGYRGVGYFTQEEYDKVAECVRQKRNDLVVGQTAWYQDWETGDGHEVPIRIASIAFVPTVRQPNTDRFPSWGGEIPAFTCPDGTTISAGGDHSVRGQPGNLTIGSIDEQGAFTGKVQVGDSQSERAAKAERVLAELPTCTSAKGENFVTFYEKWRRTHKTQFSPN